MSKSHILLIRLNPVSGAAAEARLRERVLAEIARGSAVTVLTTTRIAKLLDKMPVTLWRDGAPRGLLRLLELMRRLSWAQFSAIYDLDGSLRTRLYRYLVRPCPPWHSEPAFHPESDKPA